MAVTILLFRPVKVISRQKQRKIYAGSELDRHKIIQAENSAFCLLPSRDSKLILSVRQCTRFLSFGVLLLALFTECHKCDSRSNLYHPEDLLSAWLPRWDKSEAKLLNRV